MQLRPYQVEAKDAITRAWEEVDRTLLVLPTGCHTPDQGLLMYNGQIRRADDIRVGDLLMGPDSRPRTVLYRHGGRARMRRVVPVKGDPFTVTHDHVLTLVRTSETSIPRYPCQRMAGHLTDVSISEWETWSKWRKHIHKLVRVPIDFPSRDALLLDPYVLGLLLGDGSFGTHLTITTPDEEAYRAVAAELSRFHLQLVDSGCDCGKATCWRFKSADGSQHIARFRRTVLAELELDRVVAHQKKVPFVYRTSSRRTRLAVLAGLLDSDGYCVGSGYDFISKSQALSNDLAFIARSLGLAAYVSPATKHSQHGGGGTYWRVSISGDCSVIPCRIPRRKAKARNQRKSVLRTGFSVEDAGSGRYVGFTVDGDNRYVMDDFTVTHNCGKTIVFCKLAEDCVTNGERILILAHRGELLNQAADKMAQATGLGCAVEKAERSCLEGPDRWYRIVVGSVQTLQRQQRLAHFAADHFDVIIVDEAHHVLADSYQRVLDHFADAKILGVTATPDRGDMRNLGQYFESLAYEYPLPKAIKEGYLSPIKALTIPLQLDLTGVGSQAGDFKASDLGSALDPYLHQIADEMANYCRDRKTVVFLPLIATSQKMRDFLEAKGFRAAEVNGDSRDRDQILADFDAGRYDVLCNSMLLTEGWDCPSVDCIVCLRPTRIRSLYCQIIGRGTRLAPGKDHLLLLDFLWHSERHELCRPAHLIAESDEVAAKMTANMEDAAGQAMDLEEAEEQAEGDCIAEREEALAKKLAEMKRRKRKLVDPLQFEMSIQAEDLASYQPAFGWEMGAPTTGQKQRLETLGILPDEVENAGKAGVIIDRLLDRRTQGLTTPRQIKYLERVGFQHVGQWGFNDAKALIDRIAGNRWRVPQGIDPATYRPHQQAQSQEGIFACSQSSTQ